MSPKFLASSNSSRSLLSTTREKWGQPRLPIMSLLAIFFLLCASFVEAQDSQHMRQLDTATAIEYWTTPRLAWKMDLEGYTLNRTQSVTQDPWNDDVVYVSTAEGDVVILSASDGTIKDILAPSPRFIVSNGTITQGNLMSQSGLVFGVLPDNTKFLAYTVIDVPQGKGMSSANIRVVAFSIPSHEELWSSTAMSGVNSGTPVLCQTTSGQVYIFLTYNSYSLEGGVDTPTMGRVALIEAESGDVVWLEKDSSSFLYGPPGVVPSPSYGKYLGGEGNTNDLIAWASQEQGDDPGNTYAFQLPMGFTAAAAESLSTVVLKKVRWGTSTPPVFSTNGTNMYFAVSDDELRGWTGNTAFDTTASWTAVLLTGSSDEPIRNTPTLSFDETRLFATADSSKAFHCLNAATGESKWNFRGESEIYPVARVSPDNEYVYFIHSIDGRVYSRSQETGAGGWLVSCDTYEEDCANAVYADFVLSTTGQFLYYGDLRGRIIALEVGTLVAKDSDATETPKVFGDDDLSGLIDPPGKSNKKRIGVIVTLLFMGAVASLLSSLYLIRSGRLKARTLTIDSQDEADEEIIDWSEDDDVDGIDPYEDTMISRHKAGNNNSLPAPLDTSLWDYDKSSKSIMSNHPTSPDRLSVILGTSNRIAPLHEDYSLGAAVLV
eukprot:Nitzschia sp. Nitz4//scaffold8_size234185//216945//219072//NITZ4_001303-RA/size234185-processed-gene-0.409-mRNA-1//-1//CDS//3329559944//478//frame0